MRRLRSPALFAACLSLIALQLSGLHMHINAHGYSGTPQGTHVHGQGLDSRYGDHPGAHSHEDGAHHHRGQPGTSDHSGDKDVAIVELGAGASKLLIVLVCLGLTLVVLSRPSSRLVPTHALPLPVGLDAHWRPPLRAPPRLA